VTPQKSNPIWISAAETSADIHGSQLIQAIKEYAPDISLIGMGGPEMRQQQFKSLINSESISAMGFTEVLSLLPRIFRIFGFIKQYFRSFNPQAVVLIDAPDFHFHIAKKASKLNIPVFYYISPQIWAWRKRRIHFLKKYVDKLLCILPFEKEFFAAYGLDVEFVGHPLIQQINYPVLDTIKAQDNILGVMPGSRGKELSALLPSFAQAARIVSKIKPDMHWKIFQAPNIDVGQIQIQWPKELKTEIIPFNNRYIEMKTCQLLLTASGTASLESALLQVPAIVAYKLSKISYIIGRCFVDVPYISMPNLILQKKIYPEFIQDQVTGENLAKHILFWLNNENEIKNIGYKLKRTRSILGQNHASRTSARIILGELGHKINQLKEQRTNNYPGQKQF